MSRIIDFLYRLFFDRDDSLDTLQILFACIIIITLKVVWKLATGETETPEVKIEGLVTLRWLVGLLVITAIPKWMIPSMIAVITKGQLPKSTPTQDIPDDSTETPS